MAIKATIAYKSNRNAVDTRISKQVDTAVKQGAFVMEREVKVSATSSFVQRTGHLRRSIRANDNVGFQKAQVEINPVREGGDVNYAKFLEFGTRFMAPRAFIRKGIKNAESKIMQIFKQVLK